MVLSTRGNLIDYDAFSDGKDYNSTTHEVVDDASMTLSGYFPLNDIEELQTNFVPDFWIYCFDTDKNYIGKANMSVPSGSVYGRIGMNKSMNATQLTNKTGVLANSKIFSTSLQNKYDMYDVGINQSINHLRSSIPPDIPIVEGQRLELFWESMINTNNIRNYRFVIDNGGDSPFGYYFNRKMYVDTDSTTPRTNSSVVRLIDEQGNITTQFTLNFKVVKPVNPSTEKNLLIIGDSLTDRDDGGGTPSTIYDLLQQYELTNIHEIGTQHPSTRPEVSHEGWDGWNIEYFLNPEQENNPFAFNGVVDFKAYCDAHDYSGIDYVIFNLSWHPVDENGGNPSHLVEQHELLSQKIEEAYPNVKIFWTGLPAYNYNRYHGFRNVWKTIGFDINEAYEASTSQTSNRFTVWALPQVDAEYNLSYIDSPVNARNSDIKERLLDDQVHGGDPEYQQIADAMFRKLVENL